MLRASHKDERVIINGFYIILSSSWVNEWFGRSFLISRG